MVVRLKDIAELMGVSVNTVSRALKDKPDIGEKTRQRIKEAAAALGYRPDLNARAQEIFCAGRSMPAHRKSSAPEAEPHAADARTRFLGNPVPKSSIFSSSVIGKSAACMLKYVLRGSFIFVHLSGRLKDDLKPSQNGYIDWI